MRDVDQVRARVQAAVDAAGPAGMIPDGFERELTSRLDALAREFMGQFPELPQMSLDEWLAEHHETLSETERRAGYELLAAYDEDHDAGEDAPSI
jgi:hypothetical protein